LEKILPYDEKIKYPVCIGGKMNTPFEDCGGIWNYMDILQELKNRRENEAEAEQYEEIENDYYIPHDFDPEYFNKDEINELLQQENYGVVDFF